MNLSLYLKPFLALLNGFFSKKTVITVDAYVTALKAIPDITVYGDVFPNSGVNAVIVLAKEVTPELQKFLMPNDSIVTVVVTTEAQDVKALVIAKIFDKVDDFSSALYDDMVAAINSINTKTKITKALQSYVINHLDKLSFEEFIRGQIKAKLMNVTFDSVASPAILSKITELRAGLSKDDVTLLLELFTNIYNLRINTFIESRLKSMTGQVQVY
jgi:hypothetical protein